MFAKVFQQIFDSSIANDCKVRHVFMDLLVLADSDGVVDMTVDAIARRTNAPLDEVQKAIAALCKPDASSRTKEHEGRRMIPLDANRDWGWIIVSYPTYRAMHSEEMRRSYHRQYYHEKRKPERVKEKKARNDELGGEGSDGRRTMSPRQP